MFERPNNTKEARVQPRQTQNERKTGRHRKRYSIVIHIRIDLNQEYRISIHFRIDNTREYCISIHHRMWSRCIRYFQSMNHQRSSQYVEIRILSEGNVIQQNYHREFLSLGQGSARTHIDFQSDLVPGILEQIMPDLPDLTLDRSMLYECLWSHSNLRSSARRGGVLGRCVPKSLVTDSRASSRLTRKAHFGGGPEDHGGAEVVELSHRREVVIKRCVDIEPSPKKPKSWPRLAAPSSNAASGHYCRVRKRRRLLVA